MRGGELGLERGDGGSLGDFPFTVVGTLRSLPLVEGRLRYSNSELTEIVDFRAVFFVLGDTRIILSGIVYARSHKMS